MNLVKNPFRYNFISIVTIITFAGGSISAEDKVLPLTLKQCLVLSQETSENLQIQSEKQRQAEQRLKQSKGGLLPSLSYKYSRFNRDTADGEYSGEGADSYFTVSQPLFHGFSKKEAVNLSRNDIKKEEFQYISVLRTLKAEIIQSFYSIVQLETDIANIQNTLKIMQDRLRELNERARLGKSRESEMLAVESQIATLLAQQEKTEGDRAKNIETLSRLIRVDSSALKLSDDTPAVEDAGILEKYLEAVKNRSDIESARQDAAIQYSKVRLTKGSLLPTLNLDGSLYTLRNGNSSDWNVLATLEMPLFQGGILRGKVNEEISRQQELESKISLTARDATAEVKKLHKTLLSSINQVIAYKDAYNKSEKSYQLQLRDYKLGLVNNLDVIQAMTLMSDAKRNLDKALIQVKSDRAILDNAVMP